MMSYYLEYNPETNKAIGKMEATQSKEMSMWGFELW